MGEKLPLKRLHLREINVSHGLAAAQRAAEQLSLLDIANGVRVVVQSENPIPKLVA
jgi:hypothetical protein